jgi:putative FmdB family regulatory protein
MPTYEYVCRDCGSHLEVVQSFKDTPLHTCGTCGGALRKVFSAAGIIFKGSGYYVTDSRKKPAATTSSKSEASAPSESSESSKSSSGGSSGESASVSSTAESA